MTHKSVGENKSWSAAQKEFYDSRQHQRMWYKPESFFVKNLLDKFLFFTQLSPEARILEIGCGAGRFTIPLIQAGYTITAVDISANMLQKLREDAAGLNLPQDRLELVCTDLDVLTLEGKPPFDAVIGFNVLHHLFDVSVCLKQVRTHLRPGGWAAFLEPNAGNVLHYLDTILDRGWRAERHKAVSRPQIIRLALAQNGFTHIESMNCGFFPPFLINGFPALKRVEQFLEGRPFFHPTLAFFITKGMKDYE